MKNHNYYMQLAINLAKKGLYSVASNPMVGCVIVKKNKIIAKAYHQKLGENHAEINALEQIGFDANDCDIYITLEPCSHFGKTSPCVDEIIKSNPKTVIISSLDANPKVASVDKMQNSGIKVIVGVLENQAIKLNCGFFKRMQTGLPFVTCKIASSIDGKTAMANGESEWITDNASRLDAQYLRAKNQAIITGSGTILKDNPNLNVRIDNLTSPIKIVMDRSNQITDKNLNIFSGAKTIVTAKTPKQVLTMLGEMDVNNVLIEAGNILNSSFVEQNLIDEFVFYIAPSIMGSSAKSMFNLPIEKMSEKINLKIQSIEKLDNDIKLICC